MSKATRSSGKSSAPPARRDSQKPPENPLFLPPPQPRPKLMIIFAIILIAWVAGLLAVYFATVYPARHAMH